LDHTTYAKLGKFEKSVVKKYSKVVKDVYWPKEFLLEQKLLHKVRKAPPFVDTFNNRMAKRKTLKLNEISQFYDLNDL
jgi:hypothetical protein